MGAREKEGEREKEGGRKRQRGKERKRLRDVWWPTRNRQKVVNGGNRCLLAAKIDAGSVSRGGEVDTGVEVDGWWVVAGYPVENVTHLSDEEATRDAIM